MIERPSFHSDWLTDDKIGKDLSMAIERCRNFLSDAKEGELNLNPYDSEAVGKIIKIEAGLYHHETPNNPIVINNPDLS